VIVFFQGKSGWLRNLSFFFFPMITSSLFSNDLTARLSPVSVSFFPRPAPGAASTPEALGSPGPVCEKALGARGAWGRRVGTSCPGGDGRDGLLGRAPTPRAGGDAGGDLWHGPCCASPWSCWEPSVARPRVVPGPRCCHPPHWATRSPTPASPGSALSFCSLKPLHRLLRSIFLQKRARRLEIALSPSLLALGVPSRR